MCQPGPDVLALLGMQVADDLQRAPFFRCGSPNTLFRLGPGEERAEHFAVVR